MKGKMQTSGAIEWDREAFREKAKKLREIALSRGWDGKLLTTQEKDKILKEFLKEKGLYEFARGIGLYK